MPLEPDQKKTSNAKDSLKSGFKDADTVKPTLKEVEDRLSQLESEISAPVISTGKPAAAASTNASLDLTTPTKSKNDELQVGFNTAPQGKVNLYLFWGVVLFSVIFANVPFVNWLLLPVTQFVTIVHEMGHAIATWLTGGWVAGMTTVPDGMGHGGLTFSRGGFGFVVTQAGYLGTTIFGCMLIYLSQFPRWSKHLLMLMGATMLFGAVFFTLPGLFNPSIFFASILSFVVEAIMGLSFIYAGRKLKPAMSNLMVMFLAVQTALNSLGLIWILVPHSLGLSGNAFTDATSMSVPFVPAVVWALGWMIFSLVSLFFTLKMTYGSFIFKGINKIKDRSQNKI